MNAPRIILADEHLLLADAIKQLLQPEFEVVAICGDGQELIDRAVELRPDLIVLDIGLPKLNGLLVGERLKVHNPGVKLLYLTMNLDLDVVGEAFRVGASGYVLKNSATDELIGVIRQVLRGASYVPAAMTRGLTSSFIRRVKHRKPSAKLTLRQKEVLQLLADGRTMKEVAFMLDVTPRTIAFHKYSIMEQLRLRSTAELVQFAVKSSIVMT